MGAEPWAAEPRWLTATRTTYDDLAEPYTEELRDLMARQPYDRAVLGLFADLVRDGGGGPVLDVGCGPGRVTAHLVAAGLDAAGVDLSPGMVAPVPVPGRVPAMSTCASSSSPGCSNIAPRCCGCFTWRLRGGEVDE